MVPFNNTWAHFAGNRICYASVNIILTNPVYLYIHIYGTSSVLSINRTFKKKGKGRIEKGRPELDQGCADRFHFCFFDWLNILFCFAPTPFLWYSHERQVQDYRKILFLQL